MQVGIDLGTTWTAAAVHRDGRVEIVALGDRAPTIPSVVLRREDGTVLTGDAANRRALSEPDRVAREFKRRLGDPTPLLLGGESYPAEVVVGMLLRWVLDKVREIEGEEPDAVVLTHPANWGPFKQDLLRQAAMHAGLDAGTVTLVPEPKAAAVYYASHERVADGAVIAVYDLGGGTFDAAVLRKQTGGEFELLGVPEGIERLGGLDFDAEVLAHVNAALGGALDEIDGDDPSLVSTAARVRQECVDAKEVLSADTDVSISVHLTGAQHEVRLTRSEFEELIRPAIGETVEALHRALAAAGVQPAGVHAVLLVGGSSRIPLIGQMVSSSLGCPVAVDAHPKHAVALGAAMEAAASTGAARRGSITAVVDAVEPPVTANIPIVVAPPPPPPSEAVRRVILPGAPPPRTPTTTKGSPAHTSDRSRTWLIALAAVVGVIVAALVIVVATRDDSGPSVNTVGPNDVPASSESGALQPGPPPGTVDPALPKQASPMAALRSGEHPGFDRIAVDFEDALPPGIRSVESDVAHGRVRVFLDPPRPTDASAPARLDVDSPVVRSVFYVVDNGQTYVDIYTKQIVDPLAFRLGDVAFKDGSVKGIVVIDVVPSSTTGACCNEEALGNGGAFSTAKAGTTLHVEGYGVRAAGRGVVRLLDGDGQEVRTYTVVLTASAPVNGVFRTDIDLAGLERGSYTVVFTSDDDADQIDGQPPATTQVLTLP